MHACIHTSRQTDRQTRKNRQRERDRKTESEGDKERDRLYNIEKRRDGHKPILCGIIQTGLCSKVACDVETIDFPLLRHTRWLL